MPEVQQRNDSFSDRLKALIDEKKRDGQTLRGLAKDLEVSLGVLSDWQNGNKTPRGDSIIKLAQYFDVSADYLLGLTNAKTADTDLRTVAEYTGLSETAIQKLRASTPNHILKVISEMIEQGIFLQLAWKIYDFCQTARGVVEWQKRVKHDLELAKSVSDTEYYKQVYAEIGERHGLHDLLFGWFAESGEIPQFLDIETVMKDEFVFKKYCEYVNSMSLDEIAESSDMVISLLKDLDLFEYQAIRFLTVPLERARTNGVDDLKRLCARSVHDNEDEIRDTVVNHAASSTFPTDNS